MDIESIPLNNLLMQRISLKALGDTTREEFIREAVNEALHRHPGKYEEAEK